MLERAFTLFCFVCGILTAEPLPEHLVVYESIDAMIQQKDSNLGKQVILDLYNCKSPYLDDLEWVEKKMVEAAVRAKGHVVESSFHKFLPYGISGVVVIEESHIAIHIWPQHHYAAVDIFTCCDALGVKEAAEFLISEFQSEKPIELVFTRGKGINN